MQVSYRNRKLKKSQSIATIKQNQLEKKKIFFQDSGQEKFEADLMLALNKTLQKFNEKLYIKFS